MEAQLERPSDHGHERGAHSVVEEGEQKKSVLKKVKDKAKKIKDTIKKHGHGGDQRHHHQTNVDGGPSSSSYLYESSVVRSTDLPRGNNSLENPKEAHHHHPPAAEDPHSPNNTPTNIPRNDHRGAGNQNHHHQPLNEDSSDTKDSSDKPLTESASEYAHQFAETVGPVYEKVAGAVSEKLKPGDEDKALSEVITDTLRLHKKSDDSKEEEAPPPPPRAKVTVSKEVAERLGTDRESKREGEDAVAAGEQSTGETVGEMLQNAVATWLAGSTGIQTAQDSVYNAFVNEDASSGSGGAGPTRHN